MRKMVFVGVAAALMVMVMRPAVAQDKPGVVVADLLVVTATVEAINPATRTVTLKGPQGNTVTLKVDGQVKKFDQVKVGDEVVVRHTEAVAVVVQKL
jgi:hypothetical protein